MKKGFTLVELLAVIVILSVIAIITVPIIGNVIEESKKKALEQSAYGLVSAADYYALDKLEEKDYHFVFEDGKQTSSDKLDYKGKLDVDGNLYIDTNGDISLCLYNDKYYVIKRNNGGIEIGEKTEERNCAIRPVNGKYVAYLTDDGTGDFITSSDLSLYALKTDLNDYALQSELDKTNSALLELNDKISLDFTNARSDVQSVNVFLQKVLDKFFPKKLYIIKDGVWNDLNSPANYKNTVSYTNLHSNKYCHLVGLSSNDWSILIIPVDMTYYNTMVINGYSTLDSYAGIYYYDASFTEKGHFNLRNTDTKTTIDMTSYNGIYYIGIKIHYQSPDVYIENLYLE